MKFETERLMLRPIEENDAAFLYPLINDREVAENLLNVPYPYPVQDLIPWIADCREAMDKCERFEFAVVLRESDTPVGMCSLLHIDWNEKNAELFYWLGKKYWNQGYMCEAVKCLLDCTFNQFGLEFVYGRCFTRNLASARVMRKAGMKYVTHTRQAVQKGDQQLDVIYFEMNLNDYINRK